LFQEKIGFYREEGIFKKKHYLRYGMRFFRFFAKILETNLNP